MNAFEPFRVARQTRETTFSFDFEAGRSSRCLELPNRLLGHFLDHFAKGAGLSIEMAELSWPGSWRLDHVLCEDVGQVVGRGVVEIHDRIATARGVSGRASTTVCMDEALVTGTISFEGRPRIEWIEPPDETTDGFVDSWYDEAGDVAGWTQGTNLRQFFEGFAAASRTSVVVEVKKTGNLHHVYEAAFRALGDAVGAALNISQPEPQLGTDTSGFAGNASFTVEPLEVEVA